MSYPLHPENPKLTVVTLPGAASLNDEQLLEIVRDVCNQLKSNFDEGQPFTNKLVSSSIYAGGVIERDGGWTMYVGFGLEVVQCVQRVNHV